jgi:hypothetical protein
MSKNFEGAAMIRNYTSSVQADRSIAQIERKLVVAGARNIAKQYDEQHRVSGLVFDLPVGEGEHKKTVPVALPARVERVAEAIMATYRRGPRDKQKIYQQSERTAWKLMLDWVDVQLSLIELNQAEPAEVFMPYFVCAGKKTMYQVFSENNFKMLEAPR